MSHKLAYTITPIVFVLILLLPSIKPQEQQINFVLDEANIITNDEELNILITDLNSYKNSNAQIIIFTSTDEEKIKARLEQGFYLYNLEKINGNLQSNLNILIVFNPSWTRPAIIYASSNCGLDINRIKLALDEQSIFYGQEEKQVPFLEYFYNQDYDAGFKGMVQFLVDEIKLKIDEQTCIIPQSFNQEIKPELFPDIEPIEILKTDLQRINTYQAYYEEAHSKYPEVTINLIKATTMKESAGIRTRISQDGARGLLQLMPCTAKELNSRKDNLFVLQRVKCLQCRDGTTNCNPCERYGNCVKAGPGAGYDHSLDARTNILAGTKYLKQKLNDCSALPNYVKGQEITDEEIIKCALASYNAGHGKVIKAAVSADSTSFADYKIKFKPTVSKEVVPYVTIVLGYYKWLEENNV